MDQPVDKMENEQDLLGKIKTLPAMASFEDKDLQELLRISKIARYSTGDRIVEEKNHDGWIYYLISGRVRIIKKETELAVLHHVGDIFGDVGLLNNNDLTVSVHALEDTVCLKIAVSNMDGLSNENRFIFRYAIFRSIAEIMAKRLRITTQKYIAAKKEIEQLKAQLKASKRTPE